ncbi:hypothetical protein OJF2_66860 [Aquisphaera giovannonii]|uniref:Uncharacterized protein n=1 Tax=Aquisphaera giovannonii TaxID=406548 RepID=A0A5B9WBN2_9BACT|nr:hypothetical protein [Aquisphaera giovannonii]QEH38088.1 hypothetical protein OJF2_66860 [Aquisphaera giovannonii]
MKPPLMGPIAAMLVATTLTPAAAAQDFGSAFASTPSGGTRGYDFSGFGAYLSGSSPTYVPFGGGMGGFVPYTPGPGGGLGVASPMRDPAARRPSGGMAGMGARPPFGIPSGSLTPLSPITTGGMGGMGRRPSAGGMGGLAPRVGAGRPMGGMSRPPVGGYPFRQPPSLIGPSSAGPAMSM